jgi:hypothetical protein
MAAPKKTGNQLEKHDISVKLPMSILKYHAEHAAFYILSGIHEYTDEGHS